MKTEKMITGMFKVEMLLRQKSLERIWNLTLSIRILISETIVLSSIN